MFTKVITEERWSIHISRIFGSSQNILQMLYENLVKNP